MVLSDYVFMCRLNSYAVGCTVDQVGDSSPEGWVGPLLCPETELPQLSITSSLLYICSKYMVSSADEGEACWEV